MITEKYKIRELEEYSSFGKDEAIQYANYLRNLIHQSYKGIQKSIENSQNTDDLYDIAQLLLYSYNIINKIKK